MGHKRYTNVATFSWPRSGFCVHATGKNGEVVSVYLSLGPEAQLHLYRRIKPEQRIPIQRCIDECWFEIVKERGFGLCVVLRGLPLP